MTFANNCLALDTTCLRQPGSVIADLRTDHAGETGAVCIYQGGTEHLRGKIHAGAMIYEKIMTESERNIGVVFFDVFFKKYFQELIFHAGFKPPCESGHIVTIHVNRAT